MSNLKGWYNMKIEIVTTPNDELKETGFGTFKACNHVLEAIRKMGHDARLNICQSIADLSSIVERAPDLVILAVKYITIKGAPDVWLSEYFSDNGINFTGSSRETLKYDSDKESAKTYLKTKNIKTAKYFTTIPGQYKHERDLPVAFPLFLKPLDAANGNGIDDSSYVTTFLEFQQKVLSLFNSFNQPVLVEEYLNGREFTVAILKVQNDNLIVAPIEIIPPKSTNGIRILGEFAKKNDTEELKKTEKNQLTNNVKNLAIEVFNTLGIRDFGRIDIKTDTDGNCYFMEANLVPGMTYGTSYFPEACKIAHDYSYDKVIRLIIKGGLNRIAKKIPA